MALALALTPWAAPTIAHTLTSCMQWWRLCPQSPTLAPGYISSCLYKHERMLHCSMVSVLIVSVLIVSVLIVSVRMMLQCSIKRKAAG